MNERRKTKSVLTLQLNKQNICAFWLIVLCLFCLELIYQPNPSSRHVTDSNENLQDSGTPLANDGCGLVHDALLSKWTNFTEKDIQESAEIANCLQRNAHVISQKHTWLRPDFLSRQTRKLDCNTAVTLQTVRSTIQKYRNLWFIGDSVLEQQYYFLLCMVDPSLGNHTGGVPFAGVVNNTKPATRFDSFTWVHSKGETKIMMSRSGFKWEAAETNLYKQDFPTAIDSLTKDDAIIVDAAVHYSTEHVDLMMRAVSFIAKLSTLTNTSVFYMEPTPMEWPTSNGDFASHTKHGHCQAWNPTRLLGRGEYVFLGNYTEGYSRLDDLKLKLKTPDHDIFRELYPDQMYLKNTTYCIPSCVPATWRMDVARYQLNKIPNKVNLVPQFWQHVAKGSPSGRGYLNSTPNVGDCTHKTKDAVLLMNQQLVRSMMQQQRQRNTWLSS